MKNKKTYTDIDFYLKGGQLAQEVVDIMSKKKEEQSSKTLADVMLHNSYAEMFVAGLSDSELFARNCNFVNNIDSTYDVEQLVIRLKNEKRRKIAKIRIVRSVASIAAIFIIAFIVFYSIENRAIQEPKLVCASAVDSQISTPILIKDDGTVVNLLQNTHQEVVVSKEDLPKQISYKEIIEMEAAMPVLINKIIVPHGFTYEHKLSDSTSVYLNAGSELIFPSHFPDSTREVTLTGEAFFQVQKGDKPFIVNTNYAKIKVYGTSFNVNTNMNGTVETVLLRGSVGVTFKNETEIKISPNQLISFNLDNGQRHIEEVNPSTYTAWISGYFLYENSSFDRIIADLSAWYGLEIFATVKLLESTKLSLSIDRNIPIERMIEIIEDIANVKFINERGGRYFIE